MNLRRVRAADADPRQYIDGANAAFGHWGDETFFAWAFRGDAEILFLDDDSGRPLAASGITYRTIRRANGALQRAAIMTGSWTHAEARRRGAFAQMIEATSEIAREQHALVLGFGVMESTTHRRIEASGANLHSAFYCRSPLPAPRSPHDLDVLDPDPLLFMRTTGSTFVYTHDEWRAQFIERPNAEIECIGRRGEWAAIVEHSEVFDRVHAITDINRLPLLARDRRLFCYTTLAAEAHSLAAQGFELIAGFVSVHPPDEINDLNFQNGDRM